MKNLSIYESVVVQSTCALGAQVGIPTSPGNFVLNPKCTGLFCTMIILGGGGALEAPLQISAPKGPIAAKFGTHLRNCAKSKTSVLFFSKTAYFISYDNLCKLYA